MSKYNRIKNYFDKRRKSDLYVFTDEISERSLPLGRFETFLVGSHLRVLATSSENLLSPDYRVCWMFVWHYKPDWDILIHHTSLAISHVWTLQLISGYNQPDKTTQDLNIALHDLLKEVRGSVVFTN